VKARKRFGQHFLERSWVNKVVETVGPRHDATFLEIGSGTGALTLPLASLAREIVAVEIDRDLGALLSRVAPRNVRVIIDDILAVNFRSLFPEQALPVRVVGNLPYNISSPVLGRLVESAEEGNFFSDATLMLQHEVVERLIAPPGNKRYGALTVFVRLNADVERLLALPPGAFRPAPKVRSAVVRISFRSPLAPVGSLPVFVSLVRTLFSHRRKTLLNALKQFVPAGSPEAAEAIGAVGLEPDRRPETLDVTELAGLARHFASEAG
jgi:16S rRNA (adenine1518-N6/adenine1519-N6)-dimethyltransferase